jgi:hypothetical protein
MTEPDQQGRVAEPETAEDAEDGGHGRLAERGGPSGGHQLADTRGQDDDGECSAGRRSIVDQRQAEHDRSDDEGGHADDGGVTRQRPDRGLLGDWSLDFLGDPFGCPVRVRGSHVASKA